MKRQNAIAKPETRMAVHTHTHTGILLNKGITLISLVITIVVMLILAGVTVSTLTGDNGLITKAVEAKEKSKMAEVKEKVELAAIEWTMIKSSNPNANIDEFWNILIKEGIIDDKEDVEIDGTEYTIKTNDGYEITVTISEDGNIEVGNIGKGKKILHKIKIGNISSNSISIETMLKESAKNTVLSYSYKEDKEISFTEPEELQNIDDLNVIFSKLKAGTTYTVKVEATLENGELETLTKNVTTEEIASGKITASEPTWENNLASINLKTEETGYQIQWQIDKGTGEIDESEWTTVAKGITTTNVPNLKHKDTVYTRLWDGIDGGKEASVQIEDTGKPDVTVTKESVTSNSITVTVSSQDNEWGMPDVPIYNYYIKEKDAPDYQNKYTGTDATYTFTGLVHGKEYDIKVTTQDKAENLGAGILEEIETLRVPEAIEGLEEGNIKASVEWNKTTHKATMTLETTTGYQIQWQEDKGITQIDDDENWNTGSTPVTISDKELNYTIIARLYDGKNGGSYASAKVSDGTAHDATIDIQNVVVTPGKKIAATVTLNDDESGVDREACRWVFTESQNELGETSSKFTTDGGTFDESGKVEWIPPATSGKTYWLHVLTVDRAGNKLETVSEQSVVGIVPTETTGNGNITFDTSYGLIDIVWLSETGYTISETPNLPTAANLSGMTKVTWTKSGTSWSEDGTAKDSEWGKYNEASGTADSKNSQWANAKRTDDESYFVWIPRYAYRIKYYSDANYTNLTGYYDGYGMWKADTGELREAIDKDVETVFAPNGDKYIVHPAFTDNVNFGGWSTPIRGFWTAKYEASNSNSTPVSKPNVSSWRKIKIGDCFTKAKNYDTNKKSHLMKNSEWGAVAYLTQSRYGRNGHEITINSVGYTTGGGSYNTETGALQSTTGNIYGVYDMSGGAWEYVAAWEVKVNSNSNFITNGSSFASSATTTTGKSNEYATAYLNGTTTYYGNAKIFKVGKVGDATKEVNKGGSNTLSNATEIRNWFDDYLNVAGSMIPFFKRGGGYDDGTSSGVFCSDSAYGGTYDDDGFRVVLTP